MTFSALFSDKSWLKRDGSVLDFVLDQAQDLEKRISAQDRQTLAEYFEGIRELELRIERMDRDKAEWPAPSGRRALHLAALSPR